MIYFPATLTPVPNCQGYFWDVVEHKLYSVKVAGELRELTVRRLHPAATRFGGFKWTNINVGDKYYVVSVKGRPRYLPVASLKKLELVHYDFPVVKKMETADAD